ncbi:hypothetical protein BDZ91DRAFT_307923 [Kalaharituber pfeilii]|nr:hypothetical protein BDZ91DRAFT_307923 [Kalaharituber pfeilii]
MHVREHINPIAWYKSLNGKGGRCGYLNCALMDERGKPMIREQMRECKVGDNKQYLCLQASSSSWGRGANLKYRGVAPRKEKDGGSFDPLQRMLILQLQVACQLLN